MSRISSEFFLKRLMRDPTRLKEWLKRILPTLRPLTSVHDDVMVLQKENEKLKNANAVLAKKGQ